MYSIKKAKNERKKEIERQYHQTCSHANRTEHTK